MSGKIKTLYDLLEVSESASKEMISAAYERLCAQAEGLKEVNFEQYENRLKILKEAFTILSDPTKREQYDKKLIARRTREKAGGPALMNSDGFLSSMAEVLFKPKVFIPLVGLVVIAVLFPNVTEHKRVENEHARDVMGLDLKKSAQQMTFKVLNRKEDRLDKTLEYQNQATIRQHETQNKVVEYVQQNSDRRLDMQESALATLQSEVKAEREHLDAERERLRRINQRQESKRILQDRVRSYEKTAKLIREMKAKRLGITVEQLDRMENKWNK